MQNDTPAQKLPTPPNNQALCLSAADVRKTLSRINPRKAAGPDNIPGRVLKDCAAQLTDVLTDIFNTSLSQAVVPTCLKSTTIIPVPKKSPVFCLNDYRPIALTPIMMKCFERLVMQKIKNSLPNTLDPLQFAYRPNRSMDDAISSTLHLALTHLENKDSYVRMLFIEFSSAFNTIIPQQLINKLNLLGLNNSLCNWILDFLTGRPQSVRVGHNTSSTTTLSTGAPQGCVLSPLLFTLLTHDCTAKFSSNHIIKFADDTTVVGLISNNDETHYREEVAQLAEWCGSNNLSHNVEKTKEVVMDFRRRNSTDHPPLTIDSSTVERVSSTKFLGVHITEDLTWTTSTMSLSKKAQQRLHFLRRLKRASLPPPILTTFYRGTIESVLTSCITVWYGEKTASVRNLGVIFDDHLTFKEHIAKTARSCRFALHNIRKIRPFLTEHAAQLLVQALVVSRLDYCNALLAGLPSNTIKPLQMIQNAAARLVFNEPKRTHVTPLFISLHWLPVAARIKFKTLMLAYRTTTGSAPSYFHSLLRIYIPSRSLRSASERRLVVPSQRGSKSLSRTFSFTIPGWWNNLPTPIRNAGSLSIFKQQLKTHLFRHYLTSS